MPIINIDIVPKHHIYFNIKNILDYTSKKKVLRYKNLYQLFILLFLIDQLFLSILLIIQCFQYLLIFKIIVHGYVEFYKS